MSEGFREAAAAAQWWTDQLAATEALGFKPISEQLQVFRHRVGSDVFAYFIMNNDTWDEAVEAGDPGLGAESRRLVGGDNPDDILAGALASAGIYANLRPGILPAATMWVSPGRVTVSVDGSDALELPLLGG